MADAELKMQLKRLIAKVSNGAVEAEKLGDDDLLTEFMGSMEALEVVMELETQFGVAIADMESGKDAFTSIKTLVAFVEANRT